jgi:hypothetical protein
MREMVSKLQNYISDITYVLTAMADKDFTIRSTVEYAGDLSP